MTIVETSREGPRSGVALWRQIADAIRLDIVGGKLSPGDRLAGEFALAERFAANRHTVRRALAVLADEGVLRAEHGRGTFVADARRLSYPIGRRTRFSENLAGHERRRELLAKSIERASARVAEALAIRPGARVIRLETLSFADGRALSRATGWIPEARFPDFAARFVETTSITRTFASYGLEDYQRSSTRISARHATTEEAQHLRLAPGAVVLVAEGVDVDAGGVPIHTMLTRFPADRLELVV